MGYIITMPFYNASVWLVWARVVLLENGEERLITCEFGYLVLRLVNKMHVSLSCMLSYIEIQLTLRYSKGRSYSKQFFA